MEKAFTEELPDLLNKALDQVAQKALDTVQGLYKQSFSSRSSGLAYKTIIKFPRDKTIDIFPGKISRIRNWHIGYYPDYSQVNRQLAPRHQVQEYMQYLNAGVEKNKVLAPTPGRTGDMSTGGMERIREWADKMGIAQGTREITIKRLKKRHEGRVGRPAKYREYTYKANAKQQLWMIVKGMEKRGIPKRTYGRGTHHLTQWTNYLNKGIQDDLDIAFGEVKREFERVRWEEGSRVRKGSQISGLKAIGI